jgi:hypothetical protein
MPQRAFAIGAKRRHGVEDVLKISTNHYLRIILPSRNKRRAFKQVGSDVEEPPVIRIVRASSPRTATPLPRRRADGV